MLLKVSKHSGATWVCCVRSIHIVPTGDDSVPELSGYDEGLGMLETGFATDCSFAFRSDVTNAIKNAGLKSAQARDH